MNLSIIRMFSWFAAVVFFSAPHANASSFPLEITNIKPAGTGSPAIPATNRIFRAYPGVEYNIRAAVIGGSYPFVYALSNAPSGMTINSKTGEISWPNPQSNSGTITLTVTDSESTTVTTSWAITVGTSGFYFVDDSVETNGNGAIWAPFKTIENMLDAVSDTTAIIYLRGGDYTLAARGDEDPDGPEYYEQAVAAGNLFPTVLSGEPTTWIGYPDEVVNISANRAIVAGYVYMDNLRFSQFPTGYAIRMSSNHHYRTIRRCLFTGVETPAGYTDNDNQGFIMTRESGHGYYFVMQDNTFTDFTGTSAIGSLYDAPRTLIENNRFHGNGGTASTGFNSAIAPKDDLDDSSIRGNHAVLDGQVAIGEQSTGIMYGTVNVEICFNYFENIGTDDYTPNTTSIVQVNPTAYTGTDRDTVNSYYYRNVLIGSIRLHYYDGTNIGRFGDTVFKDNVLVNDNIDTGKIYNRDFIGYDISHTVWSSEPWLAVTDTGNIKNTSKVAVINSEGKLTATYGASVGLVGWQLADGSTPMAIGSVGRRLSLAGRPIKLAEPGP